MCEGLELVVFVIEHCDRTGGALSDRWVADRLSHGQDVLLDLGCQVPHTHDLGHPGAGEIPSRRAISACLAASPGWRRVCHSMALRISSTTWGVVGSLGGLGLRRSGGTVLTTRSAGAPARQGAEPSTGLRAGAAVFEGTRRPECDLDGEFAVFGSDVLI